MYLPLVPGSPRAVTLGHFAQFELDILQISELFERLNPRLQGTPSSQFLPSSHFCAQVTRDREPPLEAARAGLIPEVTSSPRVSKRLHTPSGSGRRSH